MADEEQKEEHKEKSDEKKGGMFGKHKTLWIVGGVGAAGLLLLLFMNGNNNGSQGSSDQGVQSAQDLSQTGAGGAVDTSSLVGSGGYPNWYNPGAAENLDYWPYVPSPSNSKSSGGSSSGSSSSGSKSGSSSGGSKHKGGKTGSSGSSSGGTKTTHGGGSTGGVTHGSGHHGVSSGHKTSSSGNKVGNSKKNKSVAPNPHAGGAHGYVYTTKKGDTLFSLQDKSWPNSKYSPHQGKATSNTFIGNYANNGKILKYGKTVDKYGNIKPGTKISL